MNIHKSILGLGTALLSVIGMNGAEINVTPGSLMSEMSKIGNQESTLVIKGKIASNDFKAFEKMPESIKVLDLSNLELLGGGMSQLSREGRSSYGEGEMPAYLFFNSTVKDIKLPANLKIIGKSAFANSAIETVVINGECNEIEDYAFYGCENLKSVSLPSTVKKIGEMAFAGCRSLSDVKLPSGVNLEGAEIFKNTGLTKLDATGVARFEDYSATGMNNLQEIKINPASEIGTGAFMDNKSLKLMQGHPVDVPDLYAAASPSVNLGGGMEVVETIGDYSFASNETEVIVLGGGVSYIGEYSFANSKSLKAIDAYALGNEVPMAEETAFAGIDEGNVILYVTGDSFDYWASDPYWGRFDVRSTDSSVSVTEIENEIQVNVSSDKDKVKIDCPYGIGNYSIVGIDGITLFTGTTNDNHLEADISSYTGKIVVVKVWNSKGEKTVTLMR